MNPKGEREPKVDSVPRPERIRTAEFEKNLRGVTPPSSRWLKLAEVIRTGGYALIHPGWKNL